MTIAPLRIKHSSAGLEVSAPRPFQKGDFIGSYYETLIYHNLSSREHTTKVYRDRVLRVDLAQFLKYALQVRMQGIQFEWASKRLEDKTAIRVVPAPFVHVRSSTTCAAPKKTRGTVSTKKTRWRTHACRL